MKAILALELSSALGSVAFRAADGAEVVRQFPADRQHSGLFFENLADLRAACGLPEEIVVGLGPGSYAGIRIAIATALGLGAAAGARLLGLPSIAAFAAEEYCVVGDARRSSYFFARVKGGKLSEGPVLMKEVELRGKLEAQTEFPCFSAQALPQFRGLVQAHPSARILATLAEKCAPNEAPLEPIYLREPYITTAKPWTR